MVIFLVKEKGVNQVAKFQRVVKKASLEESQSSELGRNMNFSAIRQPPTQYNSTTNKRRKTIIHYTWDFFRDIDG